LGCFSLLARFSITKIRNRLSCRGTKWNHPDGDIAAGWRKYGFFCQAGWTNGWRFDKKACFEIRL